MSEMKITFKHPEEIRDFVNTVSKYEFDMDMRKGRVVVDAKSLLGIMHLGLNSVMELKMYSDDCEELQKQIAKYAAQTGRMKIGKFPARCVPGNLVVVKRVRLIYNRRNIKISGPRGRVSQEDNLEERISDRP